MRVRDVREADAAALSRLMTASTGLETEPAQVRQRLARSRDIEHPFVAEIDGCIVGFASLRLVPYLGEEAPYAEVSELYVVEGHRRRGIGRALLAALETRARAMGAGCLNVLTGADNTAALALYREMGLREFSVALQKWFTEDRPYRER